MNTLAKIIHDLSHDTDPDIRAAGEELRAKYNKLLDLIYYANHSGSPACDSTP